MVRTIRGAFRDLNCRGRGSETFRKVWRGGSWRWISRPLPPGKFLAGDRRTSTEGDVEIGEIVAEFSRCLPDPHCSIDGFRVVTDAEKPLTGWLPVEKPKLGVYRVTTPNGEIVDLPNPMARQ